MGSKGKFLLVVNNIDTFWSHRLPLAKAIMDDGWTLHLATSHATQDARIVSLGMIPHDLPAYTSSLNPVGQARALHSIFNAIKTVQPDIIHAITLRYSFWTGIALRLLRMDVPAAFTIAGLGSLFQSGAPQVRAVRMAVVPLMRFALGGKGRCVIFQNTDDAKLIVRTGALEKERCTVIRGSGVDTDEFGYTPEPQGDVPVVLFCSRLLKAKGIGEFVHAARIIRSKGVKARFIVAGDVAKGNHDSVSAEQLADWKDEGTVEFLGHRSDVPALMAQSNIVTLPSYYGEGVPKVLLEAAAIGRPVVTTDMPGCRETVENGVSGLLVEPKSAWSLADALETLIADPALRTSMGQKGRDRVIEGFTVEIVNAKTLGVYKRLAPATEKAALRQAA
jgi:glycosyltransferase involved in cell wall biosynthesis